MAGLLAVFFVIGLVSSLTSNVRPASAQSEVNAKSRQLKCPSPCKVSSRVGTSREIFLQGETVTSSLHISVVCPGMARLLDIAVIVDANDQMSNSELNLLKKDLAQFLLWLDLSNNPNTRIGLVSVSDRTETIIGLTNDESRILAAVNR